MMTTLYGWIKDVVPRSGCSLNSTGTAEHVGLINDRDFTDTVLFCYTWPLEDMAHKL